MALQESVSGAHVLAPIDRHVHPANRTRTSGVP
jgi:hypothetical protein